MARTFKSGAEYKNFLKSGGVPSVGDKVQEDERGTVYQTIENVKTNPQGVSFVTTSPAIISATGERQGQGQTYSTYYKEGKGFAGGGNWSESPVSGVSEQQTLDFLKFNEPSFAGYEAPPPQNRPVITGPRLGEQGAMPAPGYEAQHQELLNKANQAPQTLGVGGITTEPQVPEALSAGVSEIAKQIQALLGRVQTEGVTGPGGEFIIHPGTQEQAPGGGFTGRAVSPVQQAVQNMAQGGMRAQTAIAPPTVQPGAPQGFPVGNTPTAISGADPYTELVSRVKEAMSKQQAQPNLTEQYKTEQERAGITEKKQQIGTYSEEINKTRDLLADLDARIRGGQTREAARLAPMELITGRQEEIARQNQADRQTSADLIDSLSRSKTIALESLNIEQQDILTKLGLAEKDLQRPLEQLQNEITIRNQIKELTQKEIPNVVSSQFNDAGDLTIITQDPSTGGFSTQIMRGVGKAASKYESTTSVTNDNGDITFIGIDKNGNPVKLGTIEGASKKDTGLTPSQINTTVTSIAGAFDNEQIVKNYNTANEGYQAIKSIGVNTESPADDIAFIYAFAKIMDPNSVVREGEYNTIQRYAQTWADNFGFTAKRIFSNTNFLSSDAKQKMLNALEPKIKSIGSQYDNLREEYQRQVDDAYAGKARTITQYKISTPDNAGGEDLRSQVIRQGYDYDAMLDKGYSEEDIREAVGL